MKTTFELRSRQQFTLNGEQSGALKAALQTETTEDLQHAYRDSVCSPHGFNPVFGGNERRYRAHIGAELIRRGIDSFFYRDCFGTQTIKISAPNFLSL